MLLHYASEKFSFCVKKFSQFALNSLIQFAPMSLHFATILIKFCVVITFCGVTESFELLCLAIRKCHGSSIAMVSCLFIAYHLCDAPAISLLTLESMVKAFMF